MCFDVLNFIVFLFYTQQHIGMTSIQKKTCHQIILQEKEQWISKSKFNVCFDENIKQKDTTYLQKSAENKMYSTPNTVFQRRKCVNHCSENCSNQENIQTVNCNGLYRQMCSESEPATKQGAAYMNYYCITYMDKLRRQGGKLMPSFTVQKQVINPPVLLGPWTNFRFGCYYIILYYCIHEVYTHNNHWFT